MIELFLDGVEIVFDEGCGDDGSFGVDPADVGSAVGDAECAGGLAVVFD